MLHNITFSIPEEKIIQSLPQKKKILSNLIPGNRETYIYNTEEEYYKEYQESLFAITMKKGGWDCMRHYEIITNGCLPYFIDIENCPPNTMTLLPKDLLLECNQLYERMRVNPNLAQEYQTLQTKIMNHTIEHLTTERMARYILQKTNHEKKKENIIFIRRYPSRLSAMFNFTWI